MEIFCPPSQLSFDLKHRVFSTWMEHTPFAYDLVEALKPRLLVELGTQGGVSYFSMCQAIEEFGLPTLAYAVDTWKGDSHTDNYGEEIYDAVNKHNLEKYRGFSYLLRMFFDEALTHFSDESVDLLHIDGLHTYDAVKHDFDTWYPKVRPGGIILFHDITARIQDFGVWKFWAELQEKYPTFTFQHGFGLGVLHKPGAPLSDAPLFRFLFGPAENHEALRRYYVHSGQYFELKRKCEGLANQVNNLKKKLAAATPAPAAVPPAS